MYRDARSTKHKTVFFLYFTAENFLIRGVAGSKRVGSELKTIRISPYKQYLKLVFNMPDPWIFYRLSVMCGNSLVSKTR
jgi:hypothetical protein